MNKIFFSQSMLDTMTESGKIRLDGAVVTLLSGDAPSFELEPAYRFVKTFDGGPDPNGLVGKILSLKELKEMQAEVYLDSVIYRDLAYQADPGYIGEKTVIEKTLSDTELLSKFLLDNLL